MTTNELEERLLSLERRFEDHRHTGLDSPQITSSSPSVSSGLELVSYSTASAATSITVSGLDLVTDLRYLVLFDIETVGSLDNCALTLQINGSSATDYGSIGQERYYNASTTDSTNAFNTPGGSQAFLTSTAPATIYGTMNIGPHERNGTGFRVGGHWQLSGVGTGSNAVSYLGNWGMWWNTTQTNMTSLTLINNSGNNRDWRVLIYKFNTT